MAASGIPSARKKLARAQFHLAGLHHEVETFRESWPCEFASTFALEPPGNAEENPRVSMTVTVVQAAPVPDSWALITGDILTNCRAALDHAVFPHIRARKPDLEQRLIQFPIEDRKDQWENKTKWFDKDVRKVVSASQPYRTVEPMHTLRILRELVNMDKHRDLVIADYLPDDYRVADSEMFKVESMKVFKEGMIPGAVVARADLRLTQPLAGVLAMPIQNTVDYGETIETPMTIPPYSKPMELRYVVGGIVEAVAHVLDELEAAGC